MSLIEVVITAYSIIVAMCLTRLLDGIRPASASPARYWVHLVWLINKIFNILVIYWATWFFMEESLNFGQFLLILVPPALVYLQCDALLTKSPDEVSDWREHYFHVSRYFFGANFLLGLGLMAQAFFASSDAFPADFYPMLGVLTIVSLVAAISRHPRVHEVIAVVALLNLTLGFTSYLMRMGGTL